MINIEREISRDIPTDVPQRYFARGTPILTAYGCALLEYDTGKSYVYTAVNLISGKTELMCRRTNPLTTSGVPAMVEKIRQSSVAGTGYFEADRPYDERITFEKCREIMKLIFREVLPQHGYTIRKEQMSLAEHILESIYRRNITLAEAEVGTGKTLAYLVPAILAKRGRLNDFWNRSLYPDIAYIEMAQMPIVIATSSIALQKAIVTDYIPELSDILLTHGIIKAPITAVIRKGREHYICRQKLLVHLPFETNPKIKAILETLVKPYATIDIAEIDGLTAYVKRKISVPSRCDKNCTYYDNCQYLRFRTRVGSSAIDIQVCNHNYLLADTLRRADGLQPLIPNYQNIIIDEAHKFLQAARSMYGSELSNTMLPDIKDGIDNLNLKHEDAERLSRKMAKKLYDEGVRLFSGLIQQGQDKDSKKESERRHTADIDVHMARHLRNIRDISDGLIALLSSEPTVGNSTGRKSQIIWELKQLQQQAITFARHSELICWLETDDDKRLCAIPKDLDKRLFDDIWSKGIPAIFTSGTLSANGDFSHIKRSLGIERTGIRLSETSKPSPFNHRENTLLYISEKVPFPNQRNRAYINAVADETERLILASHGHAAVLFTSYKAMDMVWEQLKQRGLPFPLFRLDKGGIKEIERFKRSGNGVLFASGALWEGIDIPGDALSLLIIVKLPFQVPDPISEYEQTLYKDINEYKARVIVPEMLIKLKQGFGRLIRTEKDTGVVAILDSRVGINGLYRACMLNALPDCRVTNDILILNQYLRSVKPHEYWELQAYSDLLST